jgi:hypothetical protein
MNQVQFFIILVNQLVHNFELQKSIITSIWTFYQ